MECRIALCKKEKSVLNSTQAFSVCHLTAQNRISIKQCSSIKFYVETIGRREAIMFKREHFRGERKTRVHISGGDVAHIPQISKVSCLPLQGCFYRFSPKLHSHWAFYLEESFLMVLSRERPATFSGSPSCLYL